MSRSKRASALLLSFVCLLSIPTEFVFAQTRPPECNQKCERGIDTAACNTATGFGAGKNCQETSECTIHAVDADGAGPGSPIIVVTCQYSCSIEFCVWV